MIGGQRCRSACSLVNPAAAPARAGVAPVNAIRYGLQKGVMTITPRLLGNGVTGMTNFKAEYIELLKQSLCASLYDESAWRPVSGPIAQFEAAKSVVGRSKLAIVRALRQRGMALVRMHPYDAEARRQGLDWPMFGYTMTGRVRLDMLEHCINDVIDKNVPGDIVETGVWRGGSMIMARALLKVRGVEDRTIWCADSFEGMPVPTEADPNKSTGEDLSDVDYLAVSLEQVKRNFERFGLLDEQVKFLKGWFSDTLPTAPIEKISILRLDGDLYESTNDALQALYDKVSIGGYVIVDDYYGWPGCKKAVDEFREARSIQGPLTAIDAASAFWQRIN